MNASHVLLSCICVVALSACCNCPEETICTDHGVILKKEARSISRTVMINRAPVATVSYTRHFTTDKGRFSVDAVTFEKFSEGQHYTVYKRCVNHADTCMYRFINKNITNK